MISGIWEAPFGRNKRWASRVPGWVNQVVGGWSVQSIFHAQSGPPLAFGNLLFTGSVKDIALESNKRTIDRWFNVDAGFNKLPNAQLASNTRTFPLRLSGVRAPGYNNFDLAAMKNFVITEKVGLQLRASAQDALNHPVFGAPNTAPTSSAFGQITTTLGAGQRIVTVSARLAW
jgi:hypothetical protein